MTIKLKKDMPYRKVEVDLTGPEGNAFVLLGMAKGWAKDLGLDWKPIQQDAMIGDYEHLLEVFEKHFGTIFTLLR